MFEPQKTFTVERTFYILLVIILFILNLISLQIGIHHGRKLGVEEASKQFKPYTSQMLHYYPKAQ